MAEQLPVKESGLSQDEAPHAQQPVGEKVSGQNLAVFIALLIGLVVVDGVAGPLLPDGWYCAVGAGRQVHQAGTISPSAWSANNGGVTQWTQTSARSYCIHGTLWSALRDGLSSRGVSRY